MSANNPETWARLLSVIKPVLGPTAIIAGGCIRDYDLGLEPKDIDVFVNPYVDLGIINESQDIDSVWAMPKYHDQRSFEDSIDLINRLDGSDTFELDTVDLMETLAGKKDLAEYDSWSEGKLRGLAEGNWIGWTDKSGIDFELVVNIVGRDDLTDDAFTFVKDFDANVVRAYFDGKDIHRSLGYAVDIAAHTYTVTKDVPSAKRRYERFNARHPGRLKLKEAINVLS